MRGADLGWAEGITAGEGWGFVRSDFRRILDHTPGGSFVAWKGPLRVGMLTTMCHGRTCWIGNVVIAAGHRGQGIGGRLVRAALGFSAGRGMRRTALLARERLAGFYSALGFRRDARYIGLGGVPRAAAACPEVVPVTPALLAEALVIDREACDEERRRLLQRLGRDFGRYFLVFVEGGRALGFIVGKPGRGLVDVGPWVAARGRPDVAEMLFRALAARAGKRLEVYVPARHRGVLAMLEGMGIQRVATFIEMRRGGRRRRRSPSFDMLAVAGLEKG